MVCIAQNDDTDVFRYIVPLIDKQCNVLSDVISILAITLCWAKTDQPNADVYYAFRGYLEDTLHTEELLQRLFEDSNNSIINEKILTILKVHFTPGNRDDEEDQDMAY